MSSRTQQLRQSFLLMGAVVALVLVAGFALFSSRSVTRVVERQANERGQDMATHVASLVGMYLRERRREAEALARSPAVVRAALDGSQQAISRRLPQLDTPTLERMFNQRHVLGGDPELAAYFRDYVQRSEFSELFFTESHGYSVLASNRTSDFVQSDEEWWRQAVADGLYEGAPRYDSSAAAVSLEYDVAIRAPRVSAPVGVLKAVFPLDRLSQLLTAADAGAGVRLQVVDAQGMLIVGGGGGGGKPNQAELLHPIPDAAAVPRGERPDTATVPGASGEDLVVTVPVDNGKWWVVFRQPKATAYAAARTTAASIVIWTVVLFGATLALLFAFWRRLNKRVTEPVKAAGAIASRVAGGDLSVTVVTERSGTAEVGDLLTSVHSMVVALRRLVGAIRSAADEAAAMATEISASTEQMSASTEEMSATCQDLTKRAAEQAQLVRAAADDATKILQIATILAAGAEDSVRRNSAVADVARRNKDVLDQSTVQLATLAEEVNRTLIQHVLVAPGRSEEHTSELQSRVDLVCRLLLEKKNVAQGKQHGSPNERRAEVGSLELPRRHPEDAGDQRDRGAQRSEETADEDREYAPALHERFALRQQFGMARQRPHVRDWWSKLDADPVGQPVPERGPDRPGNPNRPEIEVAGADQDTDSNQRRPGRNEQGNECKRFAEGERKNNGRRPRLVDTHKLHHLLGVSFEALEHAGGGPVTRPGLARLAR